MAFIKSELGCLRHLINSTLINFRRYNAQRSLNTVSVESTKTQNVTSQPAILMESKISSLTIDADKEAFIKNIALLQKPRTISYFTGSPFYNDLIIQLDELMEKYNDHPKVIRDKKNTKTTLWKLRQTLEIELDITLKTSEYRKIVDRLNALDLLIPKTAPNIREFLKLFQRDPNAPSAIHNENKDQKTKVINNDNANPGENTAVNGTKKNKLVLDHYGRSFAIGKRKNASAQVSLIKGDGKVLINGKTLANYFSALKDREAVLYPFEVTSCIGDYNVWVIVKGGGPTGQADAIAHGIAKCLMIHNPELKPILRRAKLVARDPRKVERKKPGRAKARKRYTW
ncbi:9613_t:CDS:2 [Ambispora gerdemannii]|uniref:Small ribosomal subunit protein uS9m n=1 Tax=Ambispora gerdemannii TaxID=144530 RepID=A0A9N8UZ99_9GLOM|nr:9613_t:CDS:2 [Ambispora gerdemannii]